jgi:predicted dithiol-disulfide oxidoreductase (DUF899 family)
VWHVVEGAQVGVSYRHAEPLDAPRDGPADAPEAENAQALTGDLVGERRAAAGPRASADEAVANDEPAQRGDHQPDGEVGDVVLGGGMAGMACSAAHDPSPLGGMAWMSMLMSALHSAPWLKLSQPDATSISTDRRLTMPNQIVSHEEWLKARLELLAAEKEFTRQRDALTRRRMGMPWERVEKPYWFEGPNGALSLADLFDGRSQLVVYHFMFGPDWDEGCRSCSFWADNFNGIPIHLNHRDVTFTAVSRAPLEKINTYKKRMGWSFPWVSSHASDFNFDYQVSFTPEQIAGGKAYYNCEVQPNSLSDEVGISVFAKNERGEVFHAYSCYSRGVDMLNGAYHYLDLVPKGRDELGLDFPMEWLRRHDQY